MIQIRVERDYESDNQAGGAVTAFTPFERKDKNVELIEVVVQSNIPVEQPVSEKPLTMSSAKIEGKYYQVIK